MAAESHSTSQRLPYVAGPEVDGVSRHAHHREHQVGTERHRLHRKPMKSVFCPISLFSPLMKRVPDLLAVVAVVNQEVLLKR